VQAVTRPVTAALLLRRLCTCRRDCGAERLLEVVVSGTVAVAGAEYVPELSRAVDLDGHPVELSALEREQALDALTDMARELDNTQHKEQHHGVTA
jgi:hypothetical protein